MNISLLDSSASSHLSVILFRIVTIAWWHFMFLFFFLLLLKYILYLCSGTTKWKMLSVATFWNWITVQHILLVSSYFFFVFVFVLTLHAYFNNEIDFCLFSFRSWTVVDHKFHGFAVFVDNFILNWPITCCDAFATEINIKISSNSKRMRNFIFYWSFDIPFHQYIAIMLYQKY